MQSFEHEELRCKICRREGKEARFFDRTSLQAHLETSHGVSLDKSSRHQAKSSDFFSRYMGKKVTIHIGDHASKISGFIREVSSYDLIVEEGDGLVVLVPKHGILYLETTDH